MIIFTKTKEDGGRWLGASSDMFHIPNFEIYSYPRNAKIPNIIPSKNAYYYHRKMHVIITKMNIIFPSKMDIIIAKMLIIITSNAYYPPKKCISLSPKKFYPQKNPYHYLD